MQFTKNMFVVICKEPDEVEGYFPSRYEEGYMTTDIHDAELFSTVEEVEEFISEYDFPEMYTYKPVEITYTIKNLKFS